MLMGSAAWTVSDLERISTFGTAAYTSSLDESSCASTFCFSTMSGRGGGHAKPGSLVHFVLHLLVQSVHQYLERANHDRPKTVRWLTATGDFHSASGNAWNLSELRMNPLYSNLKPAFPFHEFLPVVRLCRCELQAATQWEDVLAAALLSKFMDSFIHTKTIKSQLTWGLPKIRCMAPLF